MKLGFLPCLLLDAPQAWLAASTGPVPKLDGSVPGKGGFVN